jgi:hypothetical protein
MTISLDKILPTSLGEFQGRRTDGNSPGYGGYTFVGVHYEKNMITANNADEFTLKEEFAKLVSSNAEFVVDFKPILSNNYAYLTGTAMIPIKIPEEKSHTEKAYCAVDDAGFHLDDFIHQ